ncbi:hypothetical protein MHUMG1_09930 [Metarhizium humberi]|uniref:Transferase family protein n=1 Tax=Metarhizium humberi TaxID=2596975 RepID=A0A9P8M2K7_9HYPO|nr:hypothetical protein MHUMG1_09930 [Metarhizium humberi]
MEQAWSNIESAHFDLSPLDIISSHLYISNVFFFENTQSARGWLPEESLKQSLYDALRDFPMLLGRLQHGWGNTMKVVVDKDALNPPSWEVSETAALSFGTLKAEGFHRRLWPEGIRIAEPQIARTAGDASKLVRVHVARLADNSGVAIVLRIAHAVVDAKGAVAFMRHWADCCRRRNHLVVSATASTSPPPQTSPALLCRRSVMYEKLSQDARPRPLPWYMWPLSMLLVAVVSLLGLILKRNLTAGRTRSHLFRVGRDKLDAVKNLAKTSSRSSDCISYNDVLVAIFTTAYAQCTMQEKKSASSPSYKSGIFRRKPSQASAIVPCDFRHRLGVPEGYTGNCAVGLFVTAPSETLLRPMTDTSVMEVARFSRSTTSAADGATIEKLIQRAMTSIRLLGDKVRILYSLMICQAFSNQSRLPFYEVDFGVGRPVFVSPMAYPRTVAVIVPPPPPPSLAMGRDAFFVYLTLEECQMGRVLGNGGFQSFAEVIY